MLPADNVDQRFGLFFTRKTRVCYCDDRNRVAHEGIANISFMHYSI